MGTVKLQTNQAGNECEMSNGVDKEESTQKENQRVSIYVIMKSKKKKKPFEIAIQQCCYKEAKQNTFSN